MQFIEVTDYVGLSIHGHLIDCFFIASTLVSHWTVCRWRQFLICQAGPSAMVFTL